MSSGWCNQLDISSEGLGIALGPVTWQQILPLAQRFGRSAYGVSVRLPGRSALPLS
jgi:hypothetical protein